MMIAPLPEHLTRRHAAWHGKAFREQRAHFADLAANGQSPEAMIISCVDSRVQPHEIFAAMAGTFFVHRNISNLVPHPTSNERATAAAVEYAVCALGVSRIIILGHTQCGGIDHALACARGQASDFTFVDGWLEAMAPALTALPENGTADDLTRAAILQSLAYLADYPFVAERLAANKLTLHGAIFDIGKGELIDCA